MHACMHRHEMSMHKANCRRRSQNCKPLTNVKIDWFNPTEERDHLNIKKLTALFVVMPIHYLLYMEMWTVIQIQLRCKCVPTLKKEKKRPYRYDSATNWITKSIITPSLLKIPLSYVIGIEQCVFLFLQALIFLWSTLYFN